MESHLHHPARLHTQSLSVRPRLGGLIMISRRKLLASLPAVLVTAVITQPKIDDCSPLPNPQYRVGEQVKTWYDLADLPELVEATGTVQGFCWQPEGWRIKVGWVYQIYFPPHRLLESDYYWDEIPEFDLESV